MAKQAGRWGRESELRAFGDRVIASPITIEMTGFDDRPDLAVTFEVHDNQLRCAEVVVTATPETEVKRRHLESISIDSLRETVAANWSMPRSVETDGALVTLLDLPSSASDVEAALRNVRATRRRDDSEHLQRVAEIYLAAEHAPTQAVADQFGVAHRTAGLYVQRARKANLIPPPSKKRSE